MADGNDNVIPFQIAEPIDEAAPKLPRETILVEAHAAIMGDRHNTHGPAEQNLATTGDLWTKYTGRKLDGHDVAIMNVLQKISRIMCGERNKDHYKDIIGWAALGWERSGGKQ